MVSTRFSHSVRHTLVLPLCRNTAASEHRRGLAAGRPAGKRTMKRKDDKRRMAGVAEMQVIDSLGVACSVAGGAQRVVQYPLSKPAEAERAGLTWWPVEKWEGVRGRVAP